MNYGASIPAAYHQVGISTGQKLKGANPAELPIQRPTKLILVVNLKAAKALGASFPTHEYAGLELLPTTRTAVSESVITERSCTIQPRLGLTRLAPSLWFGFVQFRDRKLVP